MNIFVLIQPPNADIVTINRVYIDGHKLDKYVKHHHMEHHHMEHHHMEHHHEEHYQQDFVEVTLVIPAEIQDCSGHIKQTSIGERAFKRLLSPTNLRLKLHFTTKNKNYVRFPENCFELFAASPSITEIDLSGVG